MYGTGRLPIDMIAGTDDLKIFSKNPKKAIFVRDLPYSCTARDLVDFFSDALRTPVVHAVVCKNRFGRTLQIGYVLFQSEEAVIMAVENLNGCRFIGRDIRILAYDPKAPTEPSTTGLVHVSFKTMTPQQPLVTESTLRQSFDSFGEIEHVAIRTHKFTEMGLQGGYGFLTFRLPEQNRSVVEQVRQVVIDGILYDCSWSALHTQKGFDGEDVIVDPKHGLIAARSGDPEPGMPLPSLADAGRGIAPVEDPYYASRQSAQSRHKINPTGNVGRDFRELDYDPRQRMHPSNPRHTNSLPYGNSTSSGVYYDKRTLPPGYSQPYGPPRGGYQGGEFERERTLGLQPRPEYFGSRGLQSPGYSNTAHSRHDYFQDPHDYYQDHSMKSGQSAYYGGFRPGSSGLPPNRYAGEMGMRDFPGRRDVGYDQDEYDRRSRYSSSMFPTDLPSNFPFHRSTANSGYGPSGGYAGMGRNGATMPPRHFPENDPPYFPYDREGLDDRRSGLASGPYGVNQRVELGGRPSHAELPRSFEGLNTNYSSLDMDGYGLPGSKRLEAYARQTPTEYGGAFGLPRGPTGTSSLNDFTSRSEVEGGDYFKHLTSSAKASSIDSLGPASGMLDIVGVVESRDSHKEITSNIASEHRNESSSFHMKDMVDSLWAASDATSQVPLELLEVSEDDVAKEKLSDPPSAGPSSQEKANETSNALPPGLAKVPSVTDGPMSGGSVDDQLDALIDG